jgi:polyisoprenoid-binding protein YceI
VEILEGSGARYRVREQFADQDFPNDAVGETSEVSGSIVFDSNGKVLADQSKLVVDLRTLDSDEEDRDDFLRGESLESDRFPFAEFVVRELPGLTWPLPQRGQATFQMVGDMTLHDNTSPLTWEVTAEFTPERVAGSATTNFTFGDFHMVRPSRFFLLSVEDNIRLELDFIASISEAEAERQ